MKKGKFLTDLYKKIDDKPLNVAEAINFFVNSKREKFDETIEVSLNLGVDPRHADQMVRGVVSLPHGNGKKMKVAVFAKDEKAEEAKNAGADKVGINTAAINNPDLVTEAASRFGSQAIVVAIDAKKVDDHWEVFTHGGRNPTGINALDWAKKMVKFGAGELLITSMDKDGTKTGFDNILNKLISESVQVPLIASGGVGNLQHLVDGVKVGGADAVLAASIFHYGEYSIQEAKAYMSKNDIQVR